MSRRRLRRLHAGRMTLDGNAATSPSILDSFLYGVRRGKRFSRRSHGRSPAIALLVGASATLVVTGIFVLLFPLRAAFIDRIAVPVLEAIADVRNWVADRSQIAVWTAAIGAASMIGLLSLRPPRLTRRPAHVRRGEAHVRALSDHEILIHAIHRGQRHTLYRVIVARQLAGLALQLIRQQEHCGVERAAAKLRHGTWPAPDSVKAFLKQRLPAARGLRVPERIYSENLSETVDFLARYAEGQVENR